MNYTEFLRYRLELAEETLTTAMNDRRFSNEAVEMQNDLVILIRSELIKSDIEMIGTGVGISEQYK